MKAKSESILTIWRYLSILLDKPVWSKKRAKVFQPRTTVPVLPDQETNARMGLHQFGTVTQKRHRNRQGSCQSLPPRSWCDSCLA